jgi:hypothetical protein
MTVREIGRNDEWRDVASVPSPMPSPAWFWSCDSGAYAGSQHPASNGFLIPAANAGRSYIRSHGLDGRWQPKRHETVWRAVASRKGSWNNRRRNLATIPEILPCAARLNDKRSATGGFMPAPAPAPAPAPPPAPRQSGSLFRGSGQQLRRLVASRRPEADLRRRRKLNIAVPDQLSFGSMSTRTSTISLEHAITATRKAGLICARRRFRIQVIAQR